MQKLRVEHVLWFYDLFGGGRTPMVVLTEWKRALLDILIVAGLKPGWRISGALPEL